MHYASHEKIHMLISISGSTEVDLGGLCGPDRKGISWFADKTALGHRTSSARVKGGRNEVFAVSTLIHRGRISDSFHVDRS